MNLTALMITFLRPAYTKHCINSLRATYNDIKIIVAENGEFDDDMKQFCDRVGAEYHLMPFDSGVCYARNRLVELAKTDYVLVGDDDFEYNQDAKVEQMLRFMEKNKGFDVIGGRVKEGGVLRNYQGFIDLNVGHFHYHALNVDEIKYDKCEVSGLRYCKADITFNFFIGKRSKLLAVKWDEQIKVAFEHSDWFIMLKQANGNVAFSPDPIVVHKPNIGFKPSAEYLDFRNRKSDKRRFFTKHNLAYVIDMGGHKSFSSGREEIDDISFCITTFNRVESLERLVFSIAKYYPEAKIFIGDQGKKFDIDYYGKLWKRLYEVGITNKPCAFNLPYDCGLSYARNNLVQNTPGKYKLILEDDFEFTDCTVLTNMIKLMQMNQNVGIVGGQVIQDGSKINFEFILEKDGQTLRQVSDGNKWDEFDGVKFKHTGCVMNFMLCRQGVFFDNLWDEEIKITGEHQDFFFRLSSTKWWVVFTPDCEVNHVHNCTGEYRELRKRQEFLALMMEKNNINKIEYLDGFCYELKDNQLISYTNYGNQQRDHAKT